MKKRGRGHRVKGKQVGPILLFVFCFWKKKMISTIVHLTNLAGVFRSEDDLYLHTHLLNLKGGAAIHIHQVRKKGGWR